MNSLIYDCDGVLAETERDGHLRAFNKMFKEVGLPVEWTERDYADVLQIAGGKERLRSLCTPEFIVENKLPMDSSQLDAEIANWHRVKTRIFLEIAAGDGMPARRGVRRLAEEALARDWRIGVASTSSLEAVRAIALKSLGPNIVREAVIVAGDMVPRKKPAPDVYLSAMAALGAAPENSVAVEDSRIGVTAASAAGMAVIATISHFTRDEDLSVAQIVTDELGEPGGRPLKIRSNETGLPVEDHISIDHAVACIEAHATLLPTQL
ncbi:HAD-IA family hydrolase [Zafaria sp. Z1313]|uniref:HAD-IA family hydrolase n=1 Tax=unclassified Zafaria TaxID=2828765 RepID=UPI002E77AA0C|nr:HAD-IA family hydrolase [Zafaria sp. J156]MEE1622836.1 HAD-IA family hydrolase [Zafaria sp. J156]